MFEPTVGTKSVSGTVRRWVVRASSIPVIRKSSRLQTGLSYTACFIDSIVVNELIVLPTGIAYNTGKKLRMTLESWSTHFQHFSQRQYSNDLNVVVPQ